METGNEPLVIRVAELIGDGGAEGGRRLNSLIRPALAAGGEVELDFLNVDAVTEPFFEAAVENLLDEIPLDDLLHRLIVSNMTVRDVQGLRYVLERACHGTTACPLGQTIQPKYPENP